jgi:nucleoside-diphosphate-sugar epimerase
VVLNPPLVFGQAPGHLVTLQSLNTSNQRIKGMIKGEFVEGLPPTGPVFIFCDARDVAEAHVRALEVPEAAGQRFFLVGGYFSNRRIAQVIKESHPELHKKLPPETAPDDMPPNVYGWDSSKAQKVLGLEYRDLKTCIDDTVNSIIKIAEASGPIEGN